VDYVLVKADFRGPEYAPSGWGTAEPVNLPWSPGRLTELARDRAPEPTHLLVTGHPHRPALAWIRVTRTTAGVEQDMTLTLGYGEDEQPPLDAIAPLAETLVSEHGLTTMLTSVRRASRDLTTAAEPALHYPLGDGSDAGALVELRRLADHLRAGVPGAEA